MILITGANGQLGLSLQERLNKHESLKDKVIYTDVTGNFQHLDITDFDNIMNVVNQNNVKLIVNCAAYTNVDKAEEEPDIAEALNSKAVGNLSRAVKATNGLLIHISTDYVFGGNLNNTPCKEGQSTNPTGVYGSSKLNGEKAIRHSGCNSVIIRTSWLYSEYGKNFLKTMLRLTGEKERLNVVFDQVGTPTYAGDLSSAIINVIEDYLREIKTNGNAIYSKAGIYHYSNEGVCSWYDFTKMIANISGNTKCKIFPCHSDEIPSRVVRPSYSVLDKTKIKSTFGIEIPYWLNSLERCISNIKGSSSE